MRTTHRIAHRIAEVELGSTPAIYLATCTCTCALRQPLALSCISRMRRPAANFFRSERLDRIAHCIAHRVAEVILCISGLQLEEEKLF